MCYNLRAVRDAGKQERSPGEVWGTAEARAQATSADERPAAGMPFVADSKGSVTQGKPFATEAALSAAQGKEDASRYCPVCSQRLESRRCKLMCNTCGYYMSCADYY